MVENTPYYQGRLDYKEGKEFAPPHYNPEEKREWHNGWIDQQDEEDYTVGLPSQASSGQGGASGQDAQFLILEPRGAKDWRNVAPDDEFTSVKEAEDFAQDNDLFDCIIVKFEKFV